MRYCIFTLVLYISLYGQNKSITSDYIPIDVRYHTIKIDPTFAIGYTRGLTEAEDLVRHEFHSTVFPRAQYFYSNWKDRFYLHINTILNGTIGLPSYEENSFRGYNYSKGHSIWNSLTNEVDMKYYLRKRVFVGFTSLLEGDWLTAKDCMVHRENIIDSLNLFHVKESKQDVQDKRYQATINIKPFIGLGKVYDISELVIAYEIDKIIGKYHNRTINTQEVAGVIRSFRKRKNTLDLRDHQIEKIEAIIKHIYKSQGKSYSKETSKIVTEIDKLLGYDYFKRLSGQYVKAYVVLQKEHRNEYRETDLQHGSISTLKTHKLTPEELKDIKEHIVIEERLEREEKKKERDNLFGYGTAWHYYKPIKLRLQLDIETLFRVTHVKNLERAYIDDVMIDKEVIKYMEGNILGNITIHYYPTLKSKLFSRGTLDILHQWSGEKYNYVIDKEDMSYSEWKCQFEFGISQFISKRMVYEIIGEVSYNYGIITDYDNPLHFSLSGSITWSIL